MVQVARNGGGRMHYVTSDLHGYPLDSFLRLLESAGFGDSDCLYVLGDVVDRNGDGGIAALRWIMSRPNVEFLLGNHEDMLLACVPFLDEIREESIRSLQLEQMQLYMNVSAGGRDFLLVHSGLGGFSPEKKLSDYERNDLLWYRPAADEAFFPDVLTILGHTPNGYRFGEEGKMFRTDTWIDIDTGAAGGGAPMLLRLEDLQPFYGEIPGGTE